MTVTARSTRIREDPAHSLKAAMAEAESMRLVTPELSKALDLTMRAAFNDAQAKVHVLSGELHASGHLVTDVRDDGDTWMGFMIWDPPTPHSKGVSYSVYEMARGGSHDFLRDSHIYADAIGDVIDAHLKRRFG